MIIVDGPDGSGKTTVIEKLGYERKVLRSLRDGVGATNNKGWARPGEPVVEAYRRQLTLALATEKATGARIAFDRFHLSEYVYGPILRNEQLITAGVLIEINKMLRDLKVPVILCLPPFKVTLANVGLPGRERPAFQTEGFLHMAHQGFYRASPWATTVFDYTREPLPTVAGAAVR